ncbi:MAG: Hsp70 family protein [Nannocystaceae bacterium]
MAAAHHYERRLSRPELALVADFGAGTTDFCLMHVGPATSSARRHEIVGTGGVGAAGDDLDAASSSTWCARRSARATPTSSSAASIRSASYFYKLARWHHLSFLAGTRVRTELERLRRFARHPERIAALMHHRDQPGVLLHKSVEQAKIALSQQPRATFHYADGPVEIRSEVTRAEFERWMAPTTAAISACLDDTLQRANVAPRTTSAGMFMTGGTAFVPAVRREFEQRFGAAKLRSGDELMSIASGLAMLASAPDRRPSDHGPHPCYAGAATTVSSCR